MTILWFSKIGSIIEIFVAIKPVIEVILQNFESQKKHCGNAAMLFFI